MNINETLDEVKQFLMTLTVQDLRFVVQLHDKWFPFEELGITGRENVNENDKYSMISWLMGSDPIAEKGGFLDFINTIGDI